MGDVADLVLEGVLCQDCGVYIDDDEWPDASEGACGYPRHCYGCGGDPETNGVKIQAGYDPEREEAPDAE